MSLIGPALVDGIILASLYGLLASGVVIIYNTSGVINFAQGAIAIFSVFVMKTLLDHHIGYLPAALVAIAVGAFIGVFIDRVTLAPVRYSSPLNRAIITIGWLIALQALAVLLFNAGVSTNIPPLCDSCQNQLFAIGGLGVSTQALATILVTLAIGALLTVFFRRTYSGVAMRAAAQDVNATRLMGVSVNRVSGMAWAIGGALATIGGILVAPKLGALDSGTLTLYLIQAFAAALIGGLRSLPRTAIGALVLGIVQSLIAIIPQTQSIPGLKFTTAFVLIAGALFFRPDLVKTSVQAMSEKVIVASRARWWLYVRVVVIAAIGLYLLLVGTSGGVTGFFGDSARLRWAQVFADACVFLSLVVLTGFVGQISLCQFTFAGFGAFFAAIFTTDWGLPFFFAIPLAALCTAPIGAVVGIPALRIRGLQLAVVTLAFALVGDQLFFAQSFPLSGGPAGRIVNGPAGPLDVTGDLTFHQAFWVGLGVLILVGLAVAALKRSPTGRSFFAVRYAENAATAVGISLTRIKLSAFALAAFIAGIGGGMYALTLGEVSGTSFDPGQSILYLALIILAGIRSVWGGFVAAVFFVWGPQVIAGALQHFGYSTSDAATYQQLLSGLLLILTVIVNPRGIIGGFAEIPVRIAHLQHRLGVRRGVTVPSGAEVA
jgi:branched-chain amino acid transport system permease protein